MFCIGPRRPGRDGVGYDVRSGNPLDDYTLYIWSQHSGYTLTLYDDNDNVVYQTYLFAGVQYDALPATLSGTFVLQLSDDTYLYTGVIDLE